MNEVEVIDIARDAMWTMLLVSAPVLLVGLVIGLVISIFQTLTHIQEMTLTFIPKMIAIAAALFIFGQWMLVSMMTFTHEVISMLPQAVR
jgi:flagellar biosynthetic protein FliQ